MQAPAERFKAWMTSLQHNRPFLAGAAAASALLLLFVGYMITGGKVPLWNHPPETLRIALTVLPDASLIYVAAAEGYFAEEGLDVSILPMSHGAAAIGYVNEGKADIAVASDVPFAISVMKGNNLGMIGRLVSVSDNNAIIARRDRAIVSAPDLAGKKVGVTFGASGSYFLWTYLIKHKIAPDSVTLVNLPPARLAATLADGSVDAVATWQPIVSEARAALANDAVTLTDPDAYETTFAAIGRSEFLRAHAGAIEKFMLAMLRAEEFMRSRPDEALRIVADRMKIDAGELRPTWKQYDFRVTLPQSQLISLEEEARWAMARGYVTRGAVPNFLPNLYLEALLAIQPERVTVLR